MKKLWLLTACCSLLLAEQLVATAENQASEEDEIVIPASDSFVDPAAIAHSEAPAAALVPTQPVELSTEAPATKAPIIAQSQAKLPDPTIVQHAQIDPEEDIAALAKEEQEVAEEIKSAGVVIDLGQVFAGSPTIYSVLFLLSIASVAIWAYALLGLRKTELFPPESFQTLKEQMTSRNYDLALETCQKHQSLLFGMIASAIKNRHQGSSAMLDMMKSEGKRLSASYWQKIGLLNEIAIIAPMLGLLGTVLGMFYAFYDLNRSAESISALFDGLGISVGTTVVGLIVAILALMFHAMTKYRLMRQLAVVESEAQSLAQLVAITQEKP